MLSDVIHEAVTASDPSSVSFLKSFQVLQLLRTRNKDAKPPRSSARTPPETRSAGCAEQTSLVITAHAREKTGLEGTLRAPIHTPHSEHYELYPDYSQQMFIQFALKHLPGDSTAAPSNIFSYEALA